MLQPRESVPEAPDLLHLLVVGRLHAATELGLEAVEESRVHLLEGAVAAVCDLFQAAVAGLVDPVQQTRGLVALAHVRTA